MRDETAQGSQSPRDQRHRDNGHPRDLRNGH
jgi:hypothetical protein